MSEEIFGDKPPHQVSVSEGSGNAGSSRGRSGKFKADSTRRISVNAEEGEIVSRQIHSDNEAGMHTGGDPRRSGDSADAAEQGLAPVLRPEAPADRKGPSMDGQHVPDHLVAIDTDHADENRVNLPASDPAQANLAHIEQGTSADHVVALPPSDAAGDNRAHLSSQAMADHRISLPGQAAAPDEEPLITDADVLHRKPPAPAMAQHAAEKLPPESSSMPHSEPLAQVESAGHSPAVPTNAQATHREALPAQGSEDHRVTLPADGPAAPADHTLTTQALHDHHEPVAGDPHGTNVQHLHTGSEGLREVEIGHHDHEAGHDPEAKSEENQALAHTHIEDGQAAAAAPVHEENRPPPQAVKLQADLWREGFRGRVAQIKEQVALIHENLDKLEQ